MKAPAPFAALRAWLRQFIARLPRDKADTLLLLCGAGLVLLPHLLHLPLWVSAVSLATLGWRVAITLRGTRLPPAPLLLPLALGAVGGIWLTFHTILGRDAGVAMLVLLVAFKMLEMRARRDLYVVIYLSFFLLLTTFFYSQGVGTALLMLAAVIVLFAAQLSFQFTGAVPRLRRRLWLSARLVLLAAPLALLLFVVFPRLQGPLWGMPDDAALGRTGMSDTMTPGSVSRLAQSDDLAFRVRFLDGAGAPAPALRYWRGIVLADFDGRTWTQGRAPASGPGAERLRSATGAPLRQEITLESSGNRWLYALDLPDAAPSLAGKPSALSGSLELSTPSPLDERIRYTVSSHLRSRLQAQDSLPDAERWLRLPEGYNPLTVLAARGLREQRSPVERVNAALRRFREDKFSYTLEPPPLGRDGVDEFLFLSKSGFCEYYAGAFVFLMRAADVPARVVTGYQGGELNPVDGYLTVLQSDAHAWAEVWLAGSGWVRVDPTAAVDPERVQRGARRAARRATPFGALNKLINFDADEHSLLGQLRFRMAALNNGWNQWVLNYSPERQRNAVSALAASASDPRYWAALALLAAGMALLHARRLRKRGDPVDTLYSAMCLQLARQGVARERAEGPNDFRRRVEAADLAPPRKQAAAQFLRLYVAYKYGPQPAPPRLLASLKNLLNKLR